MTVATTMVLGMQMTARFIAAPVMMHTYACCMTTAQTTQHCLAVSLPVLNGTFGRELKSATEE